LLYVAAAVVIVLALILSGLSSFYVDILWFREVDFSSVFWSVLWSKVVLGLIFGALFFAILLANLVVVQRLTPRFRVPTPEQEVIERYRQMVEPYIRYVIPGVAAFISIIVGLAAAAQWQTFLLWRSVGSVAFERPDPVFGRDPSFYIFVLPFQKFVQGWLFSALVGILVIVAIAHYFWGNIRTQGPGDRVTPAVRGHLSVLLGLILLVKAWGYFLGRFDLLLSPRGVVTGASYTDIHVQKPALFVLAIIAIVCALLFFLNIRYRIWALPAIGFGLLLLSSVVIGAIVPAAVQRFQVAPQEFQRERPYIELNIEATRFAFGLDTVEASTTSVSEGVTAAQVDDNPATINNIRLWEPRILRRNYDNLQRLRQYYEFADVDVDRYTVGGEERVVMVSPREITQSGLTGSGNNWQNRHLFYTHGYGGVASLVNTATDEGAPVFVLQDIPPAPESQINLSIPKGAQLYFGELSDVPYVVVDTNQQEFDYPSPQGSEVKTKYQGRGGIDIGGFFRKAVFAYRYRDFNLLISGLIRPDSKVLINRDIRTRVTKAAPFLKYDGDPYAAIVGGRFVYIWDAYTTTDLFPYSQRVNLATATGSPGLTGSANYIRNSVKAVVDAYDGTVRFYVVDPTDPLIQVWENAFPDLFQKGPAPAALQAHFRYPESLLQVQSDQYANYHVTEPQAFYARENFWELAKDPTDRLAGGSFATLRPYYVLLKLPGAAREQFVLFAPFTPAQRQNMVGYMAGTTESADGRFGRLKAFEFQTGQNIDGPQQVFSRINQDRTFSAERTLLSAGGSEVEFGNLLIVPVENSFLYVLPVFVSASGNAIPELKRVLVVHGGTVTIETTLDAAIAQSFDVEAPPPSTGEGGPAPTGRVAQLLQEALRHFQRAQEFLRTEDLAGYQREIQAAEALVEQANQAARSPSPSPSPTASPTG
jgi:uncharacterized membrane protein (UPF0182 family)